MPASLRCSPKGASPNVVLGISGADLGQRCAAADVLHGGLLTSSLDWCWIFYVNVPVGPCSSPSCSLSTRVSEGSDLPPSPLAGRETVDEFHAAALAAWWPDMQCMLRTRNDGDRVKEILGDIERWRRGGERIALATVVATRRSAPRPAGAKLGVSSGGELAGSVSGGCVENEVYGVAQEVLGGAGPRLLTYGISDDLALEVGLPCGGEIDVFVEEADEQLTGRLRQVIEDDRRAVLFTIVEGEGVGERWLAVEGEETDAPAGLAAEVDDLLRSGRSGVLEHEGRRVFADVFEPPLRLLVIGAVDTAEALCRAARQLGWRTIVADARGKFATPERIPSADELFVGWPDEAFDRVRPDSTTAVVVLTHEDQFDVPALKVALATEAFYVGALGSRRNQERRRERLLEAGVPEHALERISGPCGLDIGAVTPAETALSILAEILARRADRAGGPLQTAGGRIHAGVD